MPCLSMPADWGKFWHLEPRNLGASPRGHRGRRRFGNARATLTARCDSPLSESLQLRAAAAGGRRRQPARPGPRSALPRPSAPMTAPIVASSTASSRSRNRRADCRDCAPRRSGFGKSLPRWMSRRRSPPCSGGRQPLLGAIDTFERTIGPATPSAQNQRPP
jgi:hypothetical protein